MIHIDNNQREIISTNAQVIHTRAVGNVGCACIPIAAVAIAVPAPSQPAQVVDEETRSASGSEPGDEVLDVQPPRTLDRPSVERLKQVARTIEHQMTHWPYNSQCQFCIMCKKRRRQHRRRGPRVERPMNFLAHGYADHIVSKPT